MNILGKLGTNTQIIENSKPDTGWVLMLTEQPSSDHIARNDGIWTLDVDGIKERTKVRLNIDFESAMAELHDGWPDYEVQTWTVQAEEAKAWLSSNEKNKPEIPFLMSLHEQRKALGWEGTLEDLINRVMQNTVAYTAATSFLIARRHVAERQIEEAEDPSTITWDFSL